jgi:hypothetical protein
MIGGEEMDFRLTYDGPLRSDNSGSKVRETKHWIRRRLQPQLRELCQRNPGFAALTRLLRGAPGTGGVIVPGEPNWADIGAQYRRGGFEFVPLIVGAAGVVCHLEVLFLRREKPGALITKPKDEYGGDLDNRLKIFFDALRVPSADELPTGAAPDASEEPFYCLLEDDSLITKFQIETDMLLDPPPTDKRTDVRLIVRVTTRVTAANLYNFAFM